MSAPYAARPGESRGRRFAEPPSPTRSAFQRDCDRIVHATAFRRLHGKTQVFTQVLLAGDSDHYRNRLTHTVEVSRIARSLARILSVNEDLTEAIALAHDLGHPPFGHAGERALDQAMAAHGGFDHNWQTIRVVGELERRYPSFDGLNLSYEVLEGLAKHNGPAGKLGGSWPGAGPAPEPAAFGTIEAQIAAVADDIAYDAHDIDDGLRAGLLDREMLGQIEALRELAASVERDYPGLDTPRFSHELARRLITFLIEDVAGEARSRLAEFRPADADAVRQAEMSMAFFSRDGFAADLQIKAFLTRHVYRHPAVTEAMEAAGAVIGRLFARYRDDPLALPAEWRLPPQAGEAERVRRAADFLAGQTDGYALAEAARLFDASPDSR